MGNYFDNVTLTSLRAEFTERGSLLHAKDEIASAVKLLRNDIEFGM